MRVIVWFKLTDLRLHDNPIVHRAVQLLKEKPHANAVCWLHFDPSQTSARSAFDNVKMNDRRAKFVLESVKDLRKSLENIGQRLFVSWGAESKLVFSALARGVDAQDESVLLLSDDIASEEKALVKSVVDKLPSNCRVTKVWQNSLLTLEQMPFDKQLSDMPDVFTPWNKKLQKVIHFVFVKYSIDGTNRKTLNRKIRCRLQPMDS